MSGRAQELAVLAFPTPILVEVSLINFHSQKGETEAASSVQPAFLLPGYGKRTQDLLTSVFHLLSCSMSAFSPCSGDSSSLPFRQDVH